MIVYDHEFFGFRSLTRIHGSAVSKGIIPAAISVALLLIITNFLDFSLEENNEDRLTDHPYVFTVLITFITFLITFRANFSYGRYWEGATAVHLMLSKWMDSCTCVSAFHHQSSKYSQTKPYAFGQYPNRNSKSRDRFRKKEDVTETQLLEVLTKVEENNQQNHEGLLHYLKLTKHAHSSRDNLLTASKSLGAGRLIQTGPGKKLKKTQSLMIKRTSDLDTVQDAIYSPKRITKAETKSKKNLTGLVTREPAPFLQELVHLYSLMSAVAFATLRNDAEHADVPLDKYQTGMPWPPVDPDRLSKHVRAQFDQKSKFKRGLYSILGLDRNERQRTLYNAARPLKVIGGVSDAEIDALSQARGPYARVSLCFFWIQEFISREQLNGGLGAMHPAIVSRCFQFVSDGMKGYNDARKSAYIPFPFPHAQITSLYVTLILVIFPFLFVFYSNNVVFACILNFTTVLCFVGLHEVARELENPFRAFPNNHPLTTFQAHFNEALLVSCSGYHPDFWHDVPEDSLDEERLQIPP